MRKRTRSAAPSGNWLPATCAASAVTANSEAALNDAMLRREMRGAGFLLIVWLLKNGEEILRWIQSRKEVSAAMTAEAARSGRSERGACVGFPPTGAKPSHWKEASDVAMRSVRTMSLHERLRGAPGARQILPLPFCCKGAVHELHHLVDRGWDRGLDCQPRHENRCPAGHSSQRDRRYRRRLHRRVAHLAARGRRHHQRWFLGRLVRGLARRRDHPAGDREPLPSRPRALR